MKKIVTVGILFCVGALVLFAQRGLRNPIILTSSNVVFPAGGAETNYTARPEADMTNTVWTTEPLWSKINGVVGSDDGDVVTSDSDPVNTEFFVVRLTDTKDPGASTDHTLRMRSAKATAAGANYDIICTLREGWVSEASPGTLIAGVTNLDESTTTLATDEWTLTAAQANSITDYTDLFCRCWGQKNGGGANRDVQIADIEFQVEATPGGDTMVTNGLIVRYWIDEADSGTSPTTLEDDGLGTDLDLTIGQSTARDRL